MSKIVIYKETVYFLLKFFKKFLLSVVCRTSPNIENVIPVSKIKVWALFVSKAFTSHCLSITII